jgi:hypothetical protein
MGVPLRRSPSLESPEDIEKQIRSLLMEGRILDAQDLLESVGPDVPIAPKLREVLAPAKVVKGSDVRDVDRSAEYRWLRTQGGRYVGQWVALVGSELVASAPTLKELRAQLAARPDTCVPPLLHRIE